MNLILSLLSVFILGSVNMQAGNKVFLGASVKARPLLIKENKSPDMSNVLVSEKKYGLLTNMPGMERWNNQAFDGSIVAIHQLNGYIFNMGGGTFSRDTKWLEWTELLGLNTVTGIDYDPTTGYIYAVDYNDHCIIKAKIDGSDTTKYGSFGGSGVGKFYYPTDICFDADTGDIYICDTNHRIVKTKINGDGWTTYGSYGNRSAGSGKFNYPNGISLNPSTKDIYIADFLNARIVKTKINGDGWTTYGSDGDGVGEFRHLNGMDFDPSTGYIYTFDTGWQNSRIVKTKINGDGWTTYGTKASGGAQGEFWGSSGLSVNHSTGRIYVGDHQHNRVIETTITGSIWNTNELFADVDAVYIDSSEGHIYVGSDSVSGRIIKTTI